jgi:putative ABC transport system permease protein
MVGTPALSANKRDVSRLVALPFQKSIQMAYQSIRIRFFRSMVTTMSLVLAVAFLAFIKVGNDKAQ